MWIALFERKDEKKIAKRKYLPQNKFQMCTNAFICRREISKKKQFPIKFPFENIRGKWFSTHHINGFDSEVCATNSMDGCLWTFEYGLNHTYLLNNRVSMYLFRLNHKVLAHSNAINLRQSPSEWMNERIYQ